MNTQHEKWEFLPHRLMANRHVQTVLGVHLPRRYATEQAIQHCVTLGDGDQIVLHEDRPLQSADDQHCVLLIHGLAGCYLSTYMRRMAEKLVGKGNRVFRMDMRDCGAGAGLARRPSHCGRSSDVASALHAIAELYPDASTSIVAYSMGGTITANMLAEAGEIRIANLDRSFVICPPIDLEHVERHFRTSWGRIYDKILVRNIWSQLLARWKRFPDIAPSNIPERPNRLRDFDDMITAPSGGFTSAEDYYRKASPGPKLASIRQPLTIFFSEDDPVVPMGPLLDFPRSSSVQVITTRHGGHLGFLAKRGTDSDVRWLDWRILEWLQQDECSSPGANESTAQVQTV